MFGFTHRMKYFSIPRKILFSSWQGQTLIRVLSSHHCLRETGNWHFPHPTTLNEVIQWHRDRVRIPQSPKGCMDGCIQFYNGHEKEKGSQEAAYLNPRGPRESTLCIIIPTRCNSSILESVTKWHCWDFLNTSSHPTRMGAKLVLIERV